MIAEPGAPGLPVEVPPTARCGEETIRIHPPRWHPRGTTAGCREEAGIAGVVAILARGAGVAPMEGHLCQTGEETAGQCSAERENLLVTQ
jgi:hypothetical protein